ncbi:MAG: DNA internalization-related competence protein ComEC/Rec2 [Candidatus Omnitrophica bacterium]|nr:DNA internalization-related competence protein ComEC/Rec2 [Candidatus Omnitrophota bacterium]
MRQPLLVFFGALAAGILAERHIGFPPEVWTACCAILILLSFVLRRADKCFAVLLVASSVLMGGVSASHSVCAVRASSWEATILALDGNEVSFEGTVEDNLNTRPVRGAQVWTGFWMGDLRRAGAAGSGVRVPGRLKVSWIGPDTGLAYGDRVVVRGTVELPRGLRNPGGFDERLYMARRNVFGVLRADEIRKTGRRGGLKGLALSARSRLSRKFRDALAPSAAGMVEALFLGERSGLDTDFKASLADTGVMHLFAISGLHVGVLAGLVWMGLRLVVRSEKARIVGLLMFLFFYSVLTGGKDPVVRATVMAAAYWGGRLWGMKSSSLNALGLAGSGLLLWRPEALWDPGFQLSFAAAGALVYLFPRMLTVRELRQSRSDRPAVRVWAYVKSFLIVTVLAWTATAPLVIFHFHRLSLLAVAANIVLFPMVLALCFLSMLGAIVSFLPATALGVILWPAGWLSAALVSTVNMLDSPKGMCLYLPAWQTASWVCYGLVFFWLARNRGIRLRRVRLTAMILLLLFMTTADRAAAAWLGAADRVTFFDVGQGDAALLEFKSGGTCLVDTGPPGSGRWVIGPYLRSRGLRGIDALVITHPQADHAGSAEELLHDFEIGLIVDNGDESEAEFHQRLLRLIEERGIRREKVVAGDRIGGFVRTLSIQNPAPYHSGGWDLNDRSVVLEADLGWARVFFSGDAGEKAFEYIRTPSAAGSPRILKVPHHGARMGEAARGIAAAIQPEVSVVSVGKRNRFRHPRPETMAFLTAQSARVVRTDTDGAVRIEPDRKDGVVIRQWASARAERERLPTK